MLGWGSERDRAVGAGAVVVATSVAVVVKAVVVTLSSLAQQFQQLQIGHDYKPRRVGG